MNFKRILFLGAHPDDEFGCSGSLSRFIEEKKELYFAVFSFCESSVPQGYPKNILEDELDEALEVIGVKRSHLIKFNYDVRKFPEYRQNILENLILLKNDIAPDVVMLPAMSDIHQDHSTIAIEGLRAFKHSTILGYELPQNTLIFQHSCFVRLEERQLIKKIQSLMCYKSQSHRPYTNADFIKSMATIRGVQAGVPYAEAYEMIRLMI